MIANPLEVPNESLIARLRQTVGEQAIRIVDLETLVDTLAGQVVREPTDEEIIEGLGIKGDGVEVSD